MSTARVRPASVPQLPGETLPYRFDALALLADGETMTAATATLVDVATDKSYAAGLIGSAVIQANRYVVQYVTGLRVGRTYRLVVGFTAATNKVWSMPVLIQCVAD